MKRLLVTSDIHGKWEKALEILEIEKYDISINLGDSEVPEYLVSSTFDYYVGGNNDNNFSILEKVIEVENLRIALCHGHTRGIYVQESFEEAISFAKDMKVSVVLHGHSHKKRHIIFENINVICPGSINYPRTDFGPSYALIDINNKKIINVEFKKII